MGRKKIQIRTIENDRQKTVTFARRRAGLIKKAHEIAVLCGVKVTLLIFDQKEACHLYSSEPHPDTLIAQYFTKQFTTNESKKRKGEPGEGKVAFGSRRCVAVVNEYRVVSIGSGSEDLAVKGEKKFYDPALHPVTVAQTVASRADEESTHLPAWATTPTADGPSSHFVPITSFREKPTRPPATKRSHSSANTVTLNDGSVHPGTSLPTPESRPPSGKLLKTASGTFSHLTRTNSMPTHLGLIPKATPPPSQLGLTNRAGPYLPHFDSHRTNSLPSSGRTGPGGPGSNSPSGLGHSGFMATPTPMGGRASYPGTLPLNYPATSTPYVGGPTQTAYSGMATSFESRPPLPGPLFLRYGGQPLQTTGPALTAQTAHHIPQGAFPTNPGAPSSSVASSQGTCSDVNTIGAITCGTPAPLENTLAQPLGNPCADLSHLGLDLNAIAMIQAFQDASPSTDFPLNNLVGSNFQAWLDEQVQDLPRTD
ncbi:hypothetical protein IWQ60_000377 [Tieghemiomyces parasiticus]|uniref:MADS-box domain-containing protein n=1 Tax=Tieghemiomyces parasiticus TaxID=78921 RepID=A0A9W8AG85_9FUNG|nr:hypothetical protein IWQ60_000377 [Tieghemiomyces parasiticus]